MWVDDEAQTSSARSLYIVKSCAQPLPRQEQTIYTYPAMYSALHQEIVAAMQAQGGIAWREFIDAGILRLVNSVISVTGWTLEAVKKGGEIIGVIPKSKI